MSTGTPDPTPISLPSASSLPHLLLTTPQPLILTFDPSPALPPPVSSTPSTILYAHPYLNIPPAALREWFRELRRQRGEERHVEEEGEDGGKEGGDKEEAGRKEEEELMILLATPTDPAPLVKRRRRVMGTLGIGGGGGNADVGMLEEKNKDKTQDEGVGEKKAGKEMKEHENTERHLDILNRELVLTHTLLTAQHRKLNKSSAIWEYRRWILLLLRDYTIYNNHNNNNDGGNGVNEDTTTSIDILTELALVHTSGEQHPGNYYAWSYLRWAVSTFLLTGLPNLPSTPPDTLSATNITDTLISRSLSWPLRHPSDCSGWSFLLFLYSTLPATHFTNKKRYDIVLQAVRYADEIAGGHDTLWVFVRTVVGRRGMMAEAERRAVLDVIAECVQRREKGELGEDGKRELKLQRKAVEWVKKFGEWDGGEERS